MTTSTVANETSEDDELLRILTEQPYLVYTYFPGTYAPMKYSLGEPCGECWMTHQVVNPRGMYGCDHH
ncbi:hypothetical protein A6A27_31905 [Micromonospora sp. CB01531]|nr:hypothetical protein A6A27_31905 [Micromonospora sp. CB01531]